METKTINIRKLIASEDMMIVSKATVIDERTGIEFPEVCTKELFLGADANPEDFEEILESEIDALKEKQQAALAKLEEEKKAEEEAKAKENADSEETSTEVQADSEEIPEDASSEEVKGESDDSN